VPRQSFLAFFISGLLMIDTDDFYAKNSGSDGKIYYKIYETARWADGNRMLDKMTPYSFNKNIP